MPRATIRILAVAALAIMALIGLVVRESMERAAGTEVILRMEAVDPRALLSGHYVAIDLREPIPAGQACPPGAQNGPNLVFLPLVRSGATEWIALAPRDGRYAVAGEAASRAAAARFAPLVARGRAFCTPPIAAEDGNDAQPGSLDLDLGVDRFYVDQAEAERIDAILASRRAGVDSPVSAIVSIGRDGRARMKGLLVNGQRIELSLF
ncbi:MAG: GDYXXLXY domain-containing protein [Caulobacterales bacterium]